MAPDWVGEVLFCERMGWTYDELMEAPDWWVQRARLFFNVRDEYGAELQKAATKR